MGLLKNQLQDNQSPIVNLFTGLTGASLSSDIEVTGYDKIAFRIITNGSWDRDFNINIRGKFLASDNGYQLLSPIAAPIIQWGQEAEQLRMADITSAASRAWVMRVQDLTPIIHLNITVSGAGTTGDMDIDYILLKD